MGRFNTAPHKTKVNALLWTVCPCLSRFFFLLWVPSALSAMAVFMYEFIAYIPKHRCLILTHPVWNKGTDIDVLMDSEINSESL